MLTKIRKKELIQLMKMSLETPMKELFLKDIKASVNVNDEQDVQLYIEYVEQNIESFAEDFVNQFVDEYTNNNEETKFITKEIYSYILNVIKELINNEL